MARQNSGMNQTATIKGVLKFAKLRQQTKHTVIGTTKHCSK